MEAVNEAVRKIKSLVIPHPDGKTNGIVLEIKLDETDQRSAKWSLDPSLVCTKPGNFLSFRVFPLNLLCPQLFYLALLGFVRGNRVLYFGTSKLRGP